MRYTGLQIVEACQRAGFPLENARIMAAIALAESGGDSNAIANTSREYSVGVFQIEIRTYHRQYSEECCKNLDCSAAAAFSISSRGSNFNPWTQYRNGEYKKHLAEVGFDSPKIPAPTTQNPSPSQEPSPVGGGVQIGETIQIPGGKMLILPTAGEWKAAGIVMAVAMLATLSIVVGAAKWAEPTVARAAKVIA